MYLACIHALQTLLQSPASYNKAQGIVSEDRHICIYESKTPMTADMFCGAQQYQTDIDLLFEPC